MKRDQDGNEFNLMPLVSIITVVHNGASTLAYTLESVREQCLVDVEHIIIDGASADGTVDIIKAYQRDQMHWITEPDQGIYDAMNKGISLARGEWLLFLGADDTFVDSTVLADIFVGRKLAAYDLVCGNSLYDYGRRCVPRLDWRARIFNTIQHQGAFYRRQLFDNFRYRVDIPVVADYELNFRVYMQRRGVLYIDRDVATCGSQGISHTVSQNASQLDIFKIRSRYISAWLNVLLLYVGMMNVALTSLIKCSSNK